MILLDRVYLFAEDVSSPVAAFGRSSSSEASKVSGVSKMTFRPSHRLISLSLTERKCSTLFRTTIKLVEELKYINDTPHS